MLAVCRSRVGRLVIIVKFHPVIVMIFLIYAVAVFAVQGGISLILITERTAEGMTLPAGLPSNIVMATVVLSMEAASGFPQTALEKEAPKTGHGP
jgi:hypothetical protein